MFSIAAIIIIVIILPVLLVPVIINDGFLYYVDCCIVTRVRPWVIS